MRPSPSRLRNSCSRPATPPRGRRCSAALGQAKDAPQVTIVKALGELKAAEAQRAILPLAQRLGLPLRKAALAALASIAGADSYGALTTAARKVNYRYDAANATGALLAYARNLGEKGTSPSVKKSAA